MSEFTSGPWKTQRYGHYTNIIAEKNNGLVTVVTDDPGDNGMGYANAQLMAAAPEMYEALQDAERALVAKEAREYWHMHQSVDSVAARAYAESHPTPVIQAIRDALAQATSVPHPRAPTDEET